ncbi:MAG TPA: hypothetical protein DCZ13_11945 [Porticoccaceae bacterium]|nr:hypothetical protein [Porticoccaceae bacterium]
MGWLARHDLNINPLATDRTTVESYDDAGGLVQEASASVLAIDHSVGAARILAQPERENLLLNSPDLSSWLIGAGSVITADQYTSPDGVALSADQLDLDVFASSSRITQAVTTTISTNYAYSQYLFTVVDGQTLELEAQNWLDTGLIALTDSWVRYVYTGVADESYTVARVIKRAGTADIIGVWGSQIEAGKYATSLIRSGASPTTRTATEPYFDNTSAWMQDDFVLVLPFQSPAAAADFAETLADLDNGSALITADATNFSFTDGVNTASVAHSGVWAVDTDVSVIVAAIGSSMAIGITQAGGTITWSTTATYAAPTWHTQLKLATTQAAPYYIGRHVGIYDGAEFATLGDAQTWAQNQETAGWPAPATSRKYSRRQLLGTHARRRI